jgi:hypothetical protein
MADIASGPTRRAVGRFPHPVCFWWGVPACATRSRPAAADVLQRSRHGLSPGGNDALPDGDRHGDDGGGIVPRLLRPAARGAESIRQRVGHVRVRAPDLVPAATSTPSLTTTALIPLAVQEGIG